MRPAKVNGHKLEIFDSIDELNIRRFQKYNKYMLIDSGVGSDLQDIIDHIEKAKIYIKSNPNLAYIELDNLKQAMYLGPYGRRTKEGIGRIKRCKENMDRPGH